MLWGLASSDALVQAQRTDWPHALTTEERNYVERQGFHPVASRGIETPPPFDNALEEGLQVGLDLSREEREFHQVSRGLVLLFHS